MPTLTTKVSPYKTFHVVADINTPDSALATTGFDIGVPVGAIDLLDEEGAGQDTFANTISLLTHVVTGADGDTVTQIVYGISEQGPPQQIMSIIWTIGTAQVDGTATNLWAEHAVVTSSTTRTIHVTGLTGANGVGSIDFDVTGFRHIYGVWTADSGDPTIVTSLYRYF